MTWKSRQEPRPNALHAERHETDPGHFVTTRVREGIDLESMGHEATDRFRLDAKMQEQEIAPSLVERGSVAPPSSLSHVRFEWQHGLF